MEKTEVFDARLEYGRKYLQPQPDVSLRRTLELANANEAAFISSELFWLPPGRTVEMVNERTASTPGAWGVYLLLSALTGETPTVEALARDFDKNRIAGFTLGNGEYGVPLHPLMLKDELDACESLRIPVFYHRSGALSFEYLCAVMEKHPRLTVVLSVDEEWPNERKVYPLLKAFENIHLCLSEHVWMGAIENLVRLFGAHRLLYSSSFPRRYPGGTLLMVQNADISQRDKDAVFRENMKRLTGGIGRA